MRLMSALGFCLIAFTAAGAGAQEIEPRASLTTIYSDNPFRLPSGAESAAVLDGLVGLSVLHDGTLLYVDADASETLLQPLSGGVPRQTLPSGYATLTANLVPDLLTWSVQDNIGQISSEPFQAVTAADRETVNVFTTGPDLLLPLGDRNHFVAQLQYGRDTFNGSDIDSTRYQGEAGLVHDLTSTSRLSVNYSYRKITYQNDQLYPAAEIGTAFLRYTVQTARTQLIAEGGVESLGLAGSMTSHTPHALLAFERRLSPRLTFEAEYTHTYEDASQSFVSSSRNTFTTGTDQNVQPIAEPSKTDTGYLTLSRTAGRALVSFQVTGSQDTYDATPLSNRKTYGSDLAIDYQLSALLSLDLRAGWYRENFPVMDEEDSWTEESISLVRQLGESLRVSIEYLRAQGSGTFVGNQFTENRALLTISYDPAAVRRNRLYDPAAPFRYYEQPTLGRPAPPSETRAQ